MWPFPYRTCVSNYYTRTLVFDVRATFLIPYILLAVIAFTFFVKTSRCEAVDVIEFTLSK